MREVSVHRDSAIVGYHKSILDGAGIPCFIRNENTSASLETGFFGLGQSQIFDPVLCVLDDDHYDDAVKRIRTSIASDGVDQPDWTCHVCNEIVPGNFATCWNCRDPIGDDEPLGSPMDDVETIAGNFDVSEITEGDE